MGTGANVTRGSGRAGLARVKPLPGTRPFVALPLRRALLAIVAATLVTGVLAGLARLGVAVGWGPRYMLGHGPLLVFGVFTTVIALERAVALGCGWAFGAPILGATAALAMLTGVDGAAWCVVAATAWLVVINGAIVRRQPVAFTWLMVIGSLVLVFGALGWARGGATVDVLGCWIAFLVLTIAAERVELSRLQPTPRWANPVVVGLAWALAAAASAAVLRVPAAMRVVGALLLAIGVWQLRFDIARRLLRRWALQRFIAVCVLLGAAWLAVGGAVLASAPLLPAGPRYDATLHAVFVGYVLSMVLAHAPVIVPAVARVHLPYTPALYAPIALLHGALAVRVVGDLAPAPALRTWGAVGNALALALYVAIILVTVVTRRWRRGIAGRV